MEQKKSLGVEVEFMIKGKKYTEKYPGVTAVTWEETLVSLTREISVPTEDIVASFERKHVFAVRDLYE